MLAHYKISVAAFLPEKRVEAIKAVESYCADLRRLLNEGWN